MVTITFHCTRCQSDALVRNGHALNLCVLPFPTSFTLDLFNFTLDMLRSIYREGYAYKKCRVFLSKIVPQEVLQADLLVDYSLEREYTKHGSCVSWIC